VTRAEVNKLLELAQQGDAQAFTQLMRSHQDAVFGLVSRLVRDPMVAEELVQDTFVKAHRRLDTFRGDAKLSTWLYRIAVNVCNDYHGSVVARMRREETALEAPDGTGTLEYPRGSGPEDQTVTLELANAFQSCLDGLQRTHREAFILRHQEDLSYEEIAQVLDLSQSNAKVRVHRAREMILDRLRELGHRV
jgi:RNA polymerase sigma-70 factor (ECF subfamily)